MMTNKKHIHLILGQRPLEEWIGRYEQSHQHPLNRTFHTLGIPMIVISLLAFLLAPLIRGFLEDCAVLLYHRMDLAICWPRHRG